VGGRWHRGSRFVWGLVAVALTAACLAAAAHWHWRLELADDRSQTWTWVERLSWLAALAGLIAAVIQVWQSRRPTSTSPAPLIGTFTAAKGTTASAISVRMPVEQPGGTVQGEIAVCGRDDLLEDLVVWDSSRFRMVEHERGVHILHGLGGQGKTTLAWAIAKRAEQRGIEVWWLSGAETSQLSAGMRQLAFELGAPMGEVDLAWRGHESAPDLVWRLLNARAKRWLLVIDNVNEPNTLAARGQPLAAGTGWLRPPASRNGRVLITSRESSSGRWASWCELHPVNPLRLEDAARLLIAYAPQAGFIDDARALASRLGCLPLAIRFAGTQLASASLTLVPGSVTTFRDYVDAMSEESDLHPETEEMRQGLALAWKVSQRILVQRKLAGAVDLLALLAHFAEAPVPVLLLNPAVMRTSAAFTALNAARLTRLLEALADVGLLEMLATTPARRFRSVTLHPLVRQWAKAVWSGDAGERRQLVGRLLEHITTNISRKQLRHGAEGVSSPEDPSGWPLWQVLVEHAAAHERAVAEQEHPSFQEVMVLSASTEAALCNLRARGEYQVARSLSEALYRLQSRVLGEQHPQTLANRHELALILTELGAYASARKHYEEILIRRQEALGDQDLLTLDTRHDLAYTIGQMGEYPAAQNQFDAVYEKRSALLGREHPATLASRNERARIIAERGQTHRAQDEYKATYSARVRVLGPEHPDTLTTSHELGRVLTDLREFEASVEHHRAVHKVRCRVLGAKHPACLTTRHGLAWALHNAGELAEAMRHYQAVYEARLRLLGEHHPETALVRHNIGQVLLQKGDCAAAREHFQSAYEDMKKARGEAHQQTLRIRRDLARLRVSEGEYAEAREEYREIYEGLSKALDEGHEYVVTVQRERVELLSRHFTPQSVRAEVQEILGVQEGHLHRSHPATAVTRRVLAAIDALMPIEQLDGEISALARRAGHIANRGRLVADIRAQIARIDERSAAEQSPELRVLTRRAARLMLEQVVDSNQGFARYDGMFARPPGAPTEATFLVGVSRASGESLALKTYGRERESEPWMLKLLTERDLPGFVRLFEYHCSPDGTWLLMERLEGTSLTQIWGPRDRPENPRDAICVTRELAAHCKRLHELVVRAAEWPFVSRRTGPDLSEFTRALAAHPQFYGDVPEQAPEELSASIAAWPAPVLTHGDVFAANVVRRDDGTHVLIDPDPRLAPRAFDAAKWIASAGQPTKLAPIVEAWTSAEPLDAAELAACLSVQLWQQAGIHEICKPIRDPGTVDEFGLPETFLNGELYDVDTDAMVKTSITLRKALARDRLRDMQDLQDLLNAVRVPGPHDFRTV
jgi:tetratricopeptide (TPR) repeat protein